MTPDHIDLSLLSQEVGTALSEDIGDGDVTASLIPADTPGMAQVITRETCVFCGRPWVDEVFAQVDRSVHLNWQVEDGQRIDAGTQLFSVEGPARSLLTGERTALNFAQLLSAVATRAARYADAIAHTRTRILDTRKTIPGLRMAQKYAVYCGGAVNHRMGLYDAYLIKENHIAAAGSITAAVAAARHLGDGLLVEVEVESLDQLREAVAAEADRVMLDNFDLDQMRQAVSEAGGKVELEASGGIELDNIAAVAETGVDFISVGALTKHVRAVDLSMRFVEA
ncbi:MAG: carboxylating nicotinate-nucleotide diphosphorylase [Xanthomonadales bacterium]|nr:carboxylating nicotinate-nucleotide diphosphorylase [Xanthomonadales bacterium]